MIRWKTIICRLLRHKWEYHIAGTEAKVRGCLRCNKREGQIAELAKKYPSYWQHIDWDWSSFKEWVNKRPFLFGSTVVVHRPGAQAIKQDISKFMKHGHQAPWYRKSVKAKVQPEEDD